MADQAIAVLGDDAQAMVDQIQAAEEAALSTAQAQLDQAGGQLRAIREAREAALAGAQARVQSLRVELEALMVASPTAAQVVAGY